MIGFDIGGTKCAVSIGKEIDGHLTLVQKKRIPTDLTVSPYVMIDRLCHLAEEMTDDFSRIGISCGSPLDAEKGIILSPPNLPGWDEVGIVPLLQERYHGRAYLENDANACALAEWRYGAGRGTRNMIFLTFGTGMGAGLILNGQLYRGKNGYAGEVGHVRMRSLGPVGYGKAGSFEGFASGGGLAQQARAAALAALQMGRAPAFCPRMEDLASITAASVAEAAYNGDPVAQEVYTRCGEMLGHGVALLADVLDPEVIVIGSIFARAETLLRGPMEQVLVKEALPATRTGLRIVPAALGEQLGDLAALTLASMA